LTVEIKAKEFVDWLFKLPSKKLIKPLRPGNVVAVGRRLAGLAVTQPDMNFLLGLAQDIWSLLIQVPEGRIATNEECERFLHD